MNKNSNQLPITFRVATQADAVALAQLIADSAEATLSPHYSAVQMAAFLDYYSPSAMREKIAAQSVFRAERGGQLVGTVALTAEGYVAGFYTHAEHLGQGVGAAMMRYVEDFAKQAGFQEIQLTASPVGLGFYQKLGWEQVRYFCFQHRGVDFDETLMRKRLA